MPKITKRVVDGANCPNGWTFFVWDSEIRGFGVKVLPSGLKRYILKYRVSGGGRRAQQRWYQLGTHGSITCDQARDLALTLMGRIAEGQDPQGDKFQMRKTATLREIWERFEREQLPLRKESTSGDYKRLWSANIAPTLETRPTSALKRQDIERLHLSLRSTPYQANRTLALMSRLFNLAEGWGVITQGSNPVRYVKRYPEERRERYLSFREIGQIGSTIDYLQPEIGNEAAAAIKLLLLTGARLQEILTAKWDYLDLDRHVLELPDSKTGKKTIFLNDEACAILKELLTRQLQSSTFIFQGRLPSKPLFDLKKPWQLVRDRAGLQGVRLHDLRHTMASIAVGRGTSLPIIGKLLGHKQAQTTLRYAHVDLDPALAAANEVGEAIAAAWESNKGRRPSGDDQPL